jgi:hypothetical protein
VVNIAHPMRIQLAALVNLALLNALALGCQSVTTGQSSKHPAPPETALGLGFDSLSGETRGRCLASSPSRAENGKELSSNEGIFYAVSVSELVEQLGLSAAVSLGLKAFGATLGFDKIERAVTTNRSAFLVVRIEMDAPAKSLGEYRLAADTRELLRRSPSRFYRRCGDGFIAATEQGGLFIGVIAVEQASTEELKQVTVGGGLTILGLGGRAEVSKQTRDYLERHQARYFVLQQGGSTKAWSSVDDVLSVDKLIERASVFKRGVSQDRTVTTKIVVKPYQVTANQPRRATFLDLFEQREVLSRLAKEHEEFRRAEQQVVEVLGGGKCTDPKKRRQFERAQKSYESSRGSIRARADRCLNSPDNQCTTRRLNTLDRERHEKLLTTCIVSATVDDPARQPTRGGIRKIEPRARVKGIDAPCALWQLSQVAITIAPSKADGAPWDADGSPPEVATSIRVDRKFAGTIPQRSTYDLSKSFDSLFVRPNQMIEVRLIDRDAMFDDTIANLSSTASALLPGGTLTLQSGRTQAVFTARCVE